MWSLRQRRIILVSAMSALGMAAVAFPVHADPAMDYATLATQDWGLGLQAKVSAQLQEAVAEDIVLHYEIQLAQQTEDNLGQIALAMDIDQEPVISTDTDEMLADVAPGVAEEECDK